MRVDSRMTQTTRGAAALLGALLALAACSAPGTAGTTGTTGGGGTAALGGGQPGAAGSPASTPTETPDGPDASDSPDPALSGQPVPTLPSGDPGTGSPSAPATRPATHPVAAVPAAALIDVQTLGAVAGGTWTAAAAPQDWCQAPRTPGAGAWRSQLATSDAGRLVQSVSAYRDGPAAVRAVDATTAQLTGCGFAADHDPRLGTASQLMTRTAADGTEQRVLVLADDSVGVVLLGSGSATTQAAWESLADLALGSSCAAAADGCH